MITPMEELRRKNDAEIIDMLNNKTGHSAEHLQAASLIYEERNLADPTKQALVKRYSEIKEDINTKIKEGESIDNVKSHLRSIGVSEHDAQQMIERATKKHTKVSDNKSKKKTSIKTYIILFIVGAITGYLLTRYL